MIREYTTCWVHHEPDLEVGMIQIVPSELADVSVEITRASTNDSEASFSLIERFCTAVNTGSDIDDRILKYVVEALQVLIKNEKADLSGFAQTLGIKRKKHRPRKYDKRNKEIFFEVTKHIRSMSNKEAYHEVSKVRFLSEHTIKSIYKVQRKIHIEWLLELDANDKEIGNLLGIEHFEQ